MLEGGRIGRKVDPSHAALIVVDVQSDFAANGGAFDRYLDCGDLHHGFARVKCRDCHHEYLLAFSRKRRHFYPSGHQKRGVEFGEWLCSHVLSKVPHRHVVFTIPKILRRYFLYDRNLLSDLSRCAWESLKLFLQEAVPEKNPIPGKSETSTNS